MYRIPTGYYDKLLDRDYHLHPKILVVKIAVHVQLRQLCVGCGLVRCRRRRQRQCHQFLRMTYFSPYTSIVPGLIYCIGAMGGGYSDVLNITGSYGLSPDTDWYGSAFYVFLSGDLGGYGNYYVTSSYGRKDLRTAMMTAMRVT